MWWQSVHPSLTTILFTPRFYHHFHVQRFALESQRPLDFYAHLTNVTCPNNHQTLISKALVKRTRRKWTKVKASLRNRNLLTNFGSVSKRILNSVVELTQVAKAVTSFCIFANDLRSNCIVAKC